MAGLLSQLGVGVNPFSTIVGQRIEQATDGSLASENWALNMEICDIINETDEGPKDALRAIRKRLLQNAGKNYTVVMYSLTVLETCVKNCGKRFQLLVTQKDFVQDLVKLIGPKNDPPTAVQEKVLSLIQSWAEAFHSNQEMQGVVQVFTDLKQKGIEFPTSDVETMAPIITPSRTVPFQAPMPPQNTDPVPQIKNNETSSIQPQQMDKLKKELGIVQENMRVFGEMLTELKPGKEHQSDRELLQDLCKTCQNMQSRIVELLDKVGNEKITEDLLQVNDELNNLFLRYERFEKKRAAICQTEAKQSSIEPKPLIDLEEKEETDNINKQLGAVSFDTGGATAAKNNAEISAENDADEFDMLAQSRTLEHKITQGKENSEVAAPTVEKEFQREQDIQEVERWLQDKPEDYEEMLNEQKTNSEEFNRFLAKRAAAAERLPTIGSSQSDPLATENDRVDPKTLSPLKS